MRYIGYVGIFLLLIALIFSAGCSTQGGLGLPGNTTKKTPTPTGTPIPPTGTLFVSSTPIGASIYLENLSAGYEYNGFAPINLTDVPNGKYNITLSLNGYSPSKGTVEIKGGQTITYKKTLSEAKAKVSITLTNASLTGTYSPCYWTFWGNVTNSGDIKIYGLKVTLTLTPGTKLYDPITKVLDYKDVDVGISRPFGFNVPVMCDGNYKTGWKWEGVDIKNPSNMTDDKKVSGTINI